MLPETNMNVSITVESEIMGLPEHTGSDFSMTFPSSTSFLEL